MKVEEGLGVSVGDSVAVLTGAAVSVCEVGVNVTPAGSVAGAVCVGVILAPMILVAMSVLVSSTVTVGV